MFFPKSSQHIQAVIELTKIHPDIDPEEMEEQGSIPKKSINSLFYTIKSRISHILQGGKFDFFKDVTKLLTGNVAVQALSLGLSPIMTRLFLPEYFGITAVFSSLYTLFSGFTCLRYEVSIVITKTKEEAANMLVVSVIFAFLTTSILFPLVWIFRGWIASTLKTPLLADMIWVVPIISFMIGVFNALNYWNTRQRKFSRLSFALVLQEFAMDSIRLGAGFMGFASAAALIFSNLIGSFSSFAELVRRLFREDRDSFKAINWKYIREGIVRYRKFPLFNIWAGLVSNFSLQLPTFMLAAFFSSTVIGQYSLGYRMTRLPVVMVSGAIGQVFLQRAAKARLDGNIGTLVQNTFSRLVTIGIFPMLLITLIGRDLFAVALGPKWVDAGVYSQIISMWTFFVFITSPLLTLTNIYERQEINLIINSISFICRAIALVIGGTYHNVILALSLVAISGSLIEIWFLRWALRTTGVSIIWGISKIFKGFIFCLPFLLSIWLYDWIFQPKSLMLVGVSVLIGLLYYAAVVIRDPESGKMFLIQKK